MPQLSIGLEQAMSDLNDPRVLFAAERTLLAWSRTAAGLMAFGFLIDRTGLVVQGAAPRAGTLWIGVAFVALGVVLSGLSAVQYRRAIASLRPVEIPPGYWVNLAVFMSALIAALGLALVAYLLVA
jgi:putative membrane protein